MEGVQGFEDAFATAGSHVKQVARGPVFHHLLMGQRKKGTKGDFLAGILKCFILSFEKDTEYIKIFN